MSQPDRIVSYYPPCTHYLAADLVRSTIALTAVAAAVLVLLIAHRRWVEERRSATLFLLALTMSMLTFGAAGIVALGRPPVWWYLALEIVVEATTYSACLLVISEASRGVWARRVS